MPLLQMVAGFGGRAAARPIYAPSQTHNKTLQFAQHVVCPGVKPTNANRTGSRQTAFNMALEERAGKVTVAGVLLLIPALLLGAGSSV